MDVYGLTGGIGSGKSSVGELLEAYGIPVVSADELSRMVVAKGSDGLTAVVAAFGDGVLDAKGELDRRAMARIVFPDPKKRRELEAILHPLIRERFEQVMDALDKGGHRLMVYEVPLLFEKNLQGDMKAVVLVTADDDTRIARVRQRDDVSEEEVRQRMAAQMDEEEKRRRASYVLYNNGSLDDLRREVEHLISHFLRLPPSATPKGSRPTEAKRVESPASGDSTGAVAAAVPSETGTLPPVQTTATSAEPDGGSTRRGTAAPPPPPRPASVPPSVSPPPPLAASADAGRAELVAPPPLTSVSSSLPPLPPLPRPRERKQTPLLDAAEAAGRQPAPASLPPPPATAGAASPPPSGPPGDSLPAATPATPSPNANKMTQRPSPPPPPPATPSASSSAPPVSVPPPPPRGKS